jgi:hypothetical protein
MKNVMLLGGITGAFAAIILGIYIFSTNDFKDKLNIKADKKLIKLSKDSRDTNKILSEPKLFFDRSTNYFKNTANDFITEFKNNEDFKDSLYFYIPEKLRYSSY